MPTETDQPIDIPQLVKNDMAKFLANGRGRPEYDDAVFRKQEALVAATKEIKACLDSERPDIISLRKMVDYAGDVYDQAIGFGVMRLEYTQEGLSLEEQLYSDVRQRIISFLKTYRPESWEDDNWQAFRMLFNTVCPRRLEPSEFRLAFWRLIYGEDIEGWFPSKMPRQKQETWIRYQLEKME